MQITQLIFALALNPLAIFAFLIYSEMLFTVQIEARPGLNFPPNLTETNRTEPNPTEPNKYRAILKFQTPTQGKSVRTGDLYRNKMKWAIETKGIIGGRWTWRWAALSV